MHINWHIIFRFEIQDFSLVVFCAGKPHFERLVAWQLGLILSATISECVHVKLITWRWHQRKRHMRHVLLLVPRLGEPEPWVNLTNLQMREFSQMMYDGYMGFYSVIVAATVPRCRLGQRNFAAVRRGHLSWIRRPSKWWDLHRLIDIFFHIFTYTYGNPYGFWWLICIDLWKLGAFSVSEKSFFLYRVPDPKPLASGIPRPRVPLVWAFWGKICWGIWVGFVAFWCFFRCFLFFLQNVSTFWTSILRILWWKVLQVFVFSSHEV